MIKIIIMNKRHKIIALWGASTVGLLATVGITFGYQGLLDSYAHEQVLTMPNHQRIFVSDALLRAEQVGFKVIAKAYRVPKLLTDSRVKESRVLGAQIPAPLKQEEIADISTPAVVRIFNNVEGTISFPEFSVDLVNFKLAPTSTTYAEKTSALNTGTGFFVDSQGHLLTNAHVIDKDVLMDKFILSAIDYYGIEIEKQMLRLSQAEMEALGQKILATYGGDPYSAGQLFALDLLANISDYIDQKAKVESKQTITVLNSIDDGTTIKNLADLKKLAAKGISASLVDWKPGYAKSHEDVALLKVENSPTPFLTLNSESKPTTGQQIYIIGFPSNAEIDYSDLFNRSMTQGTINALKKIDGTEVYQTDAKISQGSSGSPMLNEKGEIIGIITYQKSATKGDAFGYAIPIATGQQLMTDNGVTVSENPYMASFISGVNLSAQNLCRKANEQFATTGNIDSTFANSSLQKYITRCDELIAAGNSEDGTVYQVKEFFDKVPIYAWAASGAFVLISIGSFFLIRRMRNKPLIQPLRTIPA